MQTFGSPLWTFIFGLLIGGALTGLVIALISSIRLEKYLDRHNRIERRKPW